MISKLPAPRPTSEPGDPPRSNERVPWCKNSGAASATSKNFSGQGNIPRIAAQREDYLLKTLRDYKSGTRPGYEPTMVEALQPVGDADIVDLAHLIRRWEKSPARFERFYLLRHAILPTDH